jgi:hypothetical protein
MKSAIRGPDTPMALNLTGRFSVSDIYDEANNTTDDDSDSTPSLSILNQSMTLTGCLNTTKLISGHHGDGRFLLL